MGIKKDMRKTNYKKKYEELLIEKHTHKYIHIPRINLGYFLLFLLTLSLTIGYGFIFVQEWNLHNISFIFTCVEKECYKIDYQSLGFIPHLFFAYLMISLCFITLIAWIKGGFNNLKRYDKEGLIYGIVVGLILIGLLGGLIIGLIIGLIVGLIVGLIQGLIIKGLLFGGLGGIIIGLIVGLIGGIIIGLIREFEEVGK